MPNKWLPSKHRLTVQREHPSAVPDTCCRSRARQSCCKGTDHLCYTWAEVSVQEILVRNRNTWARGCPPPSSARMLWITAAFPPAPWLHQVLWNPSGLPCHCLQQSHSTYTALNDQVTFSNKEIKLILQTLPFYQGSCNVCCSVVELLESRDCVRIVAFHLRKRFFTLELCSWENVNYQMIWLTTIACPNM